MKGETLMTGVKIFPPAHSYQTPECGAERDARCTGRPEVREATRVEKQLCLVGRLQPAARRAPMGLRAAAYGQYDI